MSKNGINEIKRRQVILEPIIYRQILNELKNLINLIKGKQKPHPLNTNIYDYVLYPDFINEKNLKNKIFQILKVNNNKGIFSFILNELNGISVLNASSDYKNRLKNELFNIIECLNFFKSYSLIYYFHINKSNNKALYYFSQYILVDKSITKNALSSYISIFNLKDILIEEFSKDHQKLLKLDDPCQIMILICILGLQNSFRFQYLITKFNNIIEQGMIYNVLLCYKRDILEINEIINYFLLTNSNNIQPSTIDKILNEPEICRHLDYNTKILLIEKLMINYSIKVENISTIDDKEFTELCKYFIIISNNFNIINVCYFINWGLFKDVFNVIFQKDKEDKKFENTINFLKSINNVSIIKLYLGDKLIETFIKNIPSNIVSDFANIIKDNKNLIDYLLNNFKQNKKEDGVNLISELNLRKEEYDKDFDLFIIKQILNNRYKTCYNDHFDICLDFGLINQNTYNILMNIMIKKIKYKICKNNDNLISLNENEQESKDPQKQKSNKLKYKTIGKKTISNKYLSKDDKYKILILYYYGSSKYYELSETNKEIVTQIFGKSSILNKSINISYISCDKECNNITHLLIDRQKQNVIFVDEIESLISSLKYFKESKFLGLGYEWVQSLCANKSKKNASILELANEKETHVLIIDLLKLKKNKSFVDLLNEIFSNKILIGFSFRNGALEQLNDDFPKILKESNIFDLEVLYHYLFFEKIKSLSDMCEKLLGKKLNMDQQYSNWEKRELDKNQLNYAALYALVLVKLYKKLVKSS